MRRACAAVLLAHLAATVQAQEAAPVVVATAPEAAVSLLVRQGQRWLDQGRLDLAMSSTERALAADPRNTGALLLAARIAVAQGNMAAAAAYAVRLRTAGGTPDQQAAVDADLRSATLDRSVIEDARRLARVGRSEDAAARYRAAFGPGVPPAAYAREYYQTLAATPEGRDAGQRGLAQLAAAPGADDRTLLANAEALTFAPATRADGLRRLADLAGQSAVAPDAVRAWKQALGFYGNDPAAIPQFEAFLRRNPNDPDVKRRLEAARALPVAAPAGPGDELRRQGFAELETGALRPSAQRFEAALAANPADADALGGLGIVRLRESRAGEARSLLERAIAADPARGAQWRRALDGASYTLEVSEARALLRRGDTTGADTVLRRATQRNVDDATDAGSLLGEVTLRRGDPAEAEKHFRAALARRPGFAPSIAGLNQALRAQGRGAEATAPAPTPRLRPVEGGPTVNVQAAGLRAEAAGVADPASAAVLLQSAVAQAPNDPWLRLDLARVLRRQGRDGEGRALVEELAARSLPGDARGADSSYAAALLAQESGRPADAEAFLARIPPQRRTADMARLGVRVRSQAEVARAAALLPVAPADARQRLMMLAGRPDPSGSTAADVIRALGDAGDPNGAVGAARVAEATNQGAPARLAIAGALLAAGQDAEGAAALSRINEAGLTPGQQRDIAGLRTGGAIRASDRLNEAGDQAAAFERLRPALTGNAGNPDVELALARLYQGAQQPADALRIAEAVLARDPRNMDARRGAVDAAIATRDHRRAEALAMEGRAMAPNDSRATVLSARVARAFGTNAQAQSLLEIAAAQRQDELGSTMPASTVPARGTVNPFQSASPAAPAGLASVPGDRVSQEIAQQLVAVRNESAPRVMGTSDVRIRSGTAGLDKLQELSATAQASFQPRKFGGRVTARVMPVYLDAGQLAQTGDTSLRFGSNAATGAFGSGSTNARGLGLNVGYQKGELFNIDVGASPLGFPVANVVGGVEIVPRLTDAVRLRMRAERRSVLDSLVSYAGVKDRDGGQTWGGVTQTGGRLQLEASVGAGAVYVGGGYAIYRGQRVAHNAKVEAGAGFSYPIFKDRDSELTSGIDLVYFGFDNNQRGFAVGQGGYFSPSSFVAVNIPVDYRARLGDLRYRLGATAGYATFREEASLLFPNDPALQARAQVAALSNPLVPTRNQRQTRTGFVGGVRMDLDYPLSDSLTIGGGVRYDKAANWNETRVTVRLENRF